MAATIIFAGAVAPESLVVTINTGASGLVMTSVTAVAFTVRKENGEETVWPAVISQQTVSSLVATHPFVLNDVPIVARLRVMPALTVPGGTRRCAPFTLQVLA